MYDLSHLKLYFAATKDTKAFFEGKVSKVDYKAEVTEDNVEDLIDSFAVLFVTKYGFDTQIATLNKKVHFFARTHLPIAVQETDFNYSMDGRLGYDELFKIVVWLGTENSIYQKSAKVVSLEQLTVMAKGVHKESKVAPRKKHNTHYFKWRKVRGGQRSTNRKSLAREFYDIEDYQAEGYPVKQKTRVGRRFNDILDWDKPYNVYGADWKRRTKARHQYEANKNKHQYFSKKVDKYAHLQEYMVDTDIEFVEYSRRIGDD